MIFFSVKQNAIWYTRLDEHWFWKCNFFKYLLFARWSLRIARAKKYVQRKIFLNNIIKITCLKFKLIFLKWKIVAKKENLIKMIVHKYLVCYTCVSVLQQIVSSTIISNLNLMFETFNPLSMVRFFEFNDKGWNISSGCIQDMFLYLDGLHKDVLWAVKCKKIDD